MEIKTFYKVSDMVYGTENYWEKEKDAYDEAIRLATIKSEYYDVPAPITKEDLERSWYDYVEVERLSMNCSV